jgi:hypothetical protein
MRNDSHPQYYSLDEIDTALDALSRLLTECEEQSPKKINMKDYYFSAKHAMHLKEFGKQPTYINIGGLQYEYTEMIDHGKMPLSFEDFDDLKFLGTRRFE